MKKIIFGIFAHPDDEAFGPSGTLLLETRAGADLHLITLTAGESGTNPDRHDKLGVVRLEEWRTAGSLIGATSMHHLGFHDGHLSNTSFLEAVTAIESLVRETVQSYDTDISIEFMSLDLNGVSGHIDHIVASRAACFVFYSLKHAGLPVSRIRLACIPRETLPTPNINFVFMEAGRPPEEIDEIIDARSILDEVKAIMRAHHSQRNDGETHIQRRGDNVAVNYFRILQ